MTQGARVPPFVMIIRQILQNVVLFSDFWVFMDKKQGIAGSNPGIPFSYPVVKWFGLSMTW